MKIFIEFKNEVTSGQSGGLQISNRSNSGPPLNRLSKLGRLRAKQTQYRTDSNGESIFRVLAIHVVQVFTFQIPIPTADNICCKRREGRLG